jgi:RimJ/RimL family protein N-acetyltransferase
MVRTGQGTAGMQVSRLPEAIETERLVLRRWRMEDVPALYAAVDASRERVGAWLPWVRFYTGPEAAETFIRRVEDTWLTGRELPLAVTERGSGRILGGVGIHGTVTDAPIDWERGLFETGYWLRDGEEGKGYMREAVRAEIRLVFEHFGGRKLAIRCDARNATSRRVAESLGFQLDVHARNQLRTADGGLRDTLFFSLLADEAAALIQAWPIEQFEITWSDQEVLPAAPAPGEPDPVPDAAAAFARPVAIETDRLLLRPPTLDDAAALLALFERSRGKLTQAFPTFRRIITIDDARQLCATAIEGANARREFLLLAFTRDTKELIGGGEIHGIKWDLPAAEIDWWLDDGQTGQGYATEIGAAQLRFLMEAWGANRVEVWCDAVNAPSRRVAERIGFIPEGIVRQEYPGANAAFADYAIFSVIPADYERIAPSLPSIRFETD